MSAAHPVSSLRERETRWIVLLAIVIASLFGGAALDRYRFWDDEADTALFARNMLEGHGRSGWNGHNMIAFRGGQNLDTHLVQSDIPPLQYYVTAASFRLFGFTTLAGRLPFLLAGLASIWVLYLWAAQEFAPGLLRWMPPLILSVRVSFLLYMTQCRYYALTALFAAILLWSWSAAKRRPAIGCVAGALAAWGLFESNYLDAAAMAASFVVASIASPTQRSLPFLASITAALVACGAFWVATHDVIGMWNERHGATAPIKHFLTLCVWQAQGLSSGEFLPLAPLPLLALPWLKPDLANWQPAARKALIALLMIAIYIAAIAVVSPQDTTTTGAAEMRYDIPIMLIGTITIAVTIGLLQACCSPLITMILTAAVLFTSIPFLGGSGRLCPVYDRIHELLDGHPSGTESVLEALDTLPAGTSVRITPRFISLPAMFYRPDLRYYAMIADRKMLAPGVRASLPSWVFCCQDRPDIVVEGLGVPGLIESDPHDADNGYHMLRTVHASWLDGSRPAMTDHSFYHDPKFDRDYGIGLLQRD